MRTASRPMKRPSESEPYRRRLRSSARSSGEAPDHVPRTPNVTDANATGVQLASLQPAAPASPALLRPWPMRLPPPYHVPSATARSTAQDAAMTPTPFFVAPAGVRQLIVGPAAGSGGSGSSSSSSGGADGTAPSRRSAFRPYTRAVEISDATVVAPLDSSGSESEDGVCSDATAASPLDLSCRGSEVGRRAAAGPDNHGAPRPATVHRYGTPTTKPLGRDPRPLSAGHVPLRATSDTPLSGRSLQLPFRDDCSYCTADPQLPANGGHCLYDVSLGYGWSRHILGLAPSPSPRSGPRLLGVTCSNCSQTMLLQL